MDEVEPSVVRRGVLGAVDAGCLARRAPGRPDTRTAGARSTRGRPLQFNSQSAASRAGRAVAAREIQGSHLLESAGFGVLEHGGHALRILLEGSETDPEADRDVFGAALQHLLEQRLDQHLRDAHRRLEGLGAVVSFASAPPGIVDARILESRQFVPIRPRHPDHADRMIGRHRVRANLIDEAETAKVLHTPTVRDVHLRMTGRRRIPLNQEGADATVLKLVRQQEPHRTAAGDQHRQRVVHRHVPAVRSGSRMSGSGRLRPAV